MRPCRLRDFREPVGEPDSERDRGHGRMSMTAGRQDTAARDEQIVYSMDFQVAVDDAFRG